MKVSLVCRLISLGLVHYSKDRDTGHTTFTITDRGRQFDDEDQAELDAAEREVTTEQVERRFEKILRKATSH